MWLDLSFNKISKIEGLEHNTKIVDLSLANNQIERIENLDGLTELQTLSLSNNNLSVINDVFYLRYANFKFGIYYSSRVGKNHRNTGKGECGLSKSEAIMICFSQSEGVTPPPKGSASVQAFFEIDQSEAP